MAIKRQIALDTETTGKNDDGSPGEHRIIEIGCVEIIDRKITNRTLHYYLNPQREVDKEAEKVHGMNWSMLKDKPLFKDIAYELIDFIRGSELLIHNAKFDTAFMDMEFKRLGMQEQTKDIASITDTIVVARQINPTWMTSLDNLCSQLQISNKHRTVHGALLDARLLAEVYIAMTGGQKDLGVAFNQQQSAQNIWKRTNGLKLPLMQVDKQSHAVHVMHMIELAQKCKQNVDDQIIASSNWSSEYNMPYLEKKDDESKGDYKKRLQAQKDEMITKLLNSDEIELLHNFIDQDNKAHKEWENRVLGLAPQLPDPFPFIDKKK